MKLTSLLLSSAAVLVAGSAFAADLPAKKAAPAAAVVACPAFGAGFFQLPGSDTCLQMAGYMTFDGSYEMNDSGVTDANYTLAGDWRLGFDVRSNTEMGVVRGYARMTSGTTDRAYVQFSGFTAGNNNSMADIAGTNAWYGISSKLGGGTGDGVRYDMAVGSSTVSLALEAAANNNSSGLADRPDVLVGFKTTAGPVDLNVVAVSHEVQAATGEAMGYAVLGRIGASLGGGFSVAMFGGVSEGAALYTFDNGSDSDADGTDLASGTNIGGEVKLAAGKGTLAIAANIATFEQSAAETERTAYGISYNYALAKGLSIEPEYVFTSTDAAGTVTETSTVYMTIIRDF